MAFVGDRQAGLTVVAPSGTPEEAGDRADALVRRARADVAMLSLQLQAALRDAEAAEEAEARAGFDALTEEVRARIEMAIEHRRRELAAELESVRAEAARLLDSARAEAEALTAPTAAAHSAVELTMPPAPAQGGGAGAPMLVDADVLVRSVATAVADVFVQRVPDRGDYAFGATRPGVVVPRRSLWASVAHLDVLLPLTAVAIVVVVLLAWFA